MPGRPDASSAIRELEEALMQPDVRKSRERMGELLDPEFVEFGSSGVPFNRAQVLEALEHEALEDPPPRRSIVNHEVVMLADTVALTRYRVVRVGRPGERETQSLRSSIWRQSEGRWRMLFHQGTFIPR